MDRILRCALGQRSDGRREWCVASGMADRDPTSCSSSPTSADRLNVKRVQAYALDRRKELRIVNLGGRGVWRIRRADLEAFREQAYADTLTWVDRHSFHGGEESPEE